MIINLEILDLLNTLFSLRVSPEIKKKCLQEDFGIAMTEEFESEVQDMCNLGKTLVEQGIEQKKPVPCPDDDSRQGTL